MEKPDVILMGLERHPLNRPRYYSDTPIVFDLDDADYLWPYARDFVIECCRGSHAVTAGSHAVADWCRQYNDDVSVIWTGSPLPKRRGDTPSSQRDRIIAWGHSRPYDYREEGEHLCRILCALARQTSFQFWLYGVRKQAEMAYLLDPLRAAGVPVRTFRIMPYKDFLRSMDQVAIGIHIISPENQYSHGKSFGKVLGYLASQVAVVASDAIDHRLFFEQKKNGMLADTDDEWVNSLHWLLDHPEERDAMVAQASVDFENRLSTRATAARYDAVFRRVIARARGGLTV